MTSKLSKSELTISFVRSNYKIQQQTCPKYLRKSSEQFYLLKPGGAGPGLCSEPCQMVDLGPPSPYGILKIFCIFVWVSLSLPDHRLMKDRENITLICRPSAPHKTVSRFSGNTQMHGG